MTLTTLPELRLELAGAPLPAEALAALAEVTVRQRLSQPSQLELIFRDPPGPLGALELLTPGSRLRLSLTGREPELFRGEVTVHELHYLPDGGRELRVRAYDLLHRLRKRQQVRAHREVTVAELARELTADLGLEIEAAEAGPLWRHLIQHRQSDLELLVDAAERAGLYLSLRGERLHLLPLAGAGPELPLEPGRELLEARFSLSAEAGHTEVVAGAWNPLRLVAEQVRVGAATLTPGSASLDPLRFGAVARQLVGEAVQGEDHLQALARAERDRRAAYQTSLWALAEGDPRLRPGAVVRVRGVAAAFAGRYAVTTARHSIDGERGYVCEIATAPPPPREQPLRELVALGKVVDVDDPEGLGRVQVTLPAYQEVGCAWMHVLAPGAGPGKGLVLLPEVGDSVLLLLPAGDLGPGVVLGGLYGQEGAPDPGVEGGAVRRYTLHTAGGHRLVFDDAAGSIRLEGAGSSYLELTPERVRLHAAADLDLEAPGRRVRIRGRRIDFERS